MNRQQLRDAKQQLKRDNAKAHDVLTEMDRALWPAYPVSDIINVFRSKTFLVQIFQEKNATRLSICRTEVDNNGKWKDGISWDELQKIKRQVGYGDHLAVEIYPMDKDVVNVANMRHLWIMDYDLNIGWKNG